MYVRTLAVSAAAMAMMGVTAGAANAAPWATVHGIGDACIGADIGRRDVAPDGRPIICGSRYVWEPDIGQRQPSDPWVSGQN